MSFYDPIIASNKAAAMVITMITAQAFAGMIRKLIPVIHESKRSPMATTVEPNIIFPAIDSRLTAIIAKMIRITIQNISVQLL